MFRFREVQLVRRAWVANRQFCVLVRQEPVLLRTQTQKTTKYRHFSFESWGMALSRSAPVAYAQEFLETVHMNSGLSWCTTIVTTSLALRIVVTLPLALYQSHIIARLANLDKEIAQIAHELRGETARAVRMYNLDEKQAKYLYRRSLKKQINNLIVRDNCHPFKSSLVIWFQLPLWISLSVALRNMAYMMPYQDMAAQALFLELSVGGALWFPNLTLPDPLFVMPLLLGITNLLNIEFHALQHTKQLTKVRKVLTYTLRGMSVLMIPIASIMPTDVTLYWLCSSGFALGQNLLMINPKFRRACRIPRTANESQTPFRDLSDRLKKRFEFNKTGT
ncbi:cytochrome c oxidase assembly protein COX18, mitochondrial [Ixodes scapularis]|uniref:cytochrome c oxidase assembly protein COX18, mitochondrial n=1 Tax=Ixodes scapularis TaxID=6945 RepID=UPI0011256898|nr:cytochrome c oxidase assembly protein COX18, mitochondrial [Ixodes scapularis]